MSQDCGGSKWYPEHTVWVKVLETYISRNYWWRYNDINTFIIYMIHIIITICNIYGEWERVRGWFEEISCVTVGGLASPKSTVCDFGLETQVKPEVAILNPESIHKTSGWKLRKRCTCYNFEGESFLWETLGFALKDLSWVGEIHPHYCR